MEIKEARKYGVFFVAGACIACFLGKRTKDKGGTESKYWQYYDVLNRWMKQREKGISIADNLRQRDIREIAIYGMGDVGKHLQEELAGTDIVIKYAVDRSFYAMSDLDIYEPESDLPEVDAVIVTPVFDYEIIQKRLTEKMDCQILSISDVINK